MPTDPISQYRVIHEGIAAVAAHCDGAVTKDGVGFDGQDTHYGRRIGQTSFDQLTHDDHVEIARIANKYRTQIETYTGVDVTTLEVVQEAKDNGTNYTSRDNARRYENGRKRSDLKLQRSCDVAGANAVAISWVKKDPDFNDLLTAVRALPGRRWSGTAWTVPADSEGLSEFLDSWDITCTPDARQLILSLTEAVKAKVAQREAVVASGLDPARTVTYNADSKLLTLTSPYDATLVNGIKALKGRRYQGGNVNTCAATIPNLRWLVSNRFVGASELLDWIEAEQGSVAEAAQAAQTRAQLLTTVSSLADPAALPESFVALFQEAVGQ